MRHGRQREGMASGDHCNKVLRCSGLQGWHPRTDAEAFQVTEDLEPEACASAIGWGNARRAESLA